MLPTIDRIDPERVLVELRAATPKQFADLLMPGIVKVLGAQPPEAQAVAREALAVLLRGLSDYPGAADVFRLLADRLQNQTTAAGAADRKSP